MDLKLLLAVSSLHFLALVSPGPDFVLTVRNALQFGRNMGFATAVGFGMGIALHVSYAVGGVAILIHKFPQIFEFVKILGALYLIWLGLSTLWAIRNPKAVHEVVAEKKVQEQTLMTGLRQGFLTNILNPKATLFTLGLFTSIIPPETNLPTLIACGVNMSVLTVLWFMVVSVLFSTKNVRMGYLTAERGINFVFAMFFLFAGTMIILK
ncbi:LysE family translocator [Peredibacter starrii]|uniref:LysE family translocator n=1 Tax=Peredibacter starrii TaxID=28202 RepID=A0AAX4HS18_9BACT|nr:LysE family translocator [Peredibacter starrii]WPU66178.1 LysE family translocator [Peredibacter starrii]